MAPGSVIKGASMLVGYNTNAIKMGEKFSDECIKLYNIPKKCSSHRVGVLDDINALAESSNVYQFKIAMKVAGIDYFYNTKANVSEDSFNTYRNTFKSFGLGVKTEIDLPVESIGYIGNKITPDLLLNFSIGQYDTYTPIQLSQYITTIANGGSRLKPRFIKKIGNKEVEPTILNKVDTKSEYLDRIKLGFNAVMDYGLGKNVMGNSPNPAGKTGTSETFIDTNGDGKIDTETVSNAFVGYAPRDNPDISITVTTPDVENPNTNINHRSYVNRRIVRDISNKYFSDYFNK
jgi:cell division protein FtsI/penicillin-binding protein 2